MQQGERVETMHIKHDNKTARRERGLEAKTQGNKGNEWVHMEASE